MRGRKSIPTALKLVTGNLGKRKLAHREPPKPKRLHPTLRLSPDQRKIWARVIKQAPFGLLQPADAQIVTQYVLAASVYEQAARSLGEGPFLIRTKSGYPVHSPWLSILNKQQVILQSLAGELGFTPSSRARLGVRDSNQPIDEDEARFFGD